MKIHHLLIAIPSLLALPCSAAISIDTVAGQFFNSSAAAVAETSLWAIIYDSSGDNVLPGGLTADTSLTTGVNDSLIYADFAGQQIITGGTIGSDTILWAGAVDGPGTSGAPGIGEYVLNSFTFAGLGVSANGKWGVYWFPDLTVATDTLGTLALEVGGLQQIGAGGAGGTIGMVMPATDDTGSSFVAAFVDTGNGGDVAPLRLTAVAVVPEVGTLALSVLGLGSLLRRRRRN